MTASSFARLQITKKCCVIVLFVEGVLLFKKTRAKNHEHVKYC
jgi:hypothetical protein